MGGEAQTATAIATVPPGLEGKVEDTVFQMMSVPFLSSTKRAVRWSAATWRRQGSYLVLPSMA